MIIRPYRYADESKVISLVEEVYRNHIDPDFSHEGRRYWLDDLYDGGLQLSLHHSDILLAEIEGEIVGVFRLQMHHRVTMLYVKTSMQRRGIGKMLLEEGIKIAKENGVKKINLISSMYAVPFYHYCGFKRVGQVYDEYGIVSQNMMMKLEAER